MKRKKKGKSKAFYRRVRPSIVNLFFNINLQNDCNKIYIRICQPNKGFLQINILYNFKKPKNKLTIFFYLIMDTTAAGFSSLREEGNNTNESSIYQQDQTMLINDLNVSINSFQEDENYITLRIAKANTVRRESYIDKNIISVDKTTRVMVHGLSVTNSPEIAIYKCKDNTYRGASYDSEVQRMRTTSTPNKFESGFGQSNLDVSPIKPSSSNTTFKRTIPNISETSSFPSQDDARNLVPTKESLFLKLELNNDLTILLNTLQEECKIIYNKSANNLKQLLRIVQGNYVMKSRTVGDIFEDIYMQYQDFLWIPDEYRGITDRVWSEMIQVEAVVSSHIPKFDISKLAESKYNRTSREQIIILAALAKALEARLVLSYTRHQMNTTKRVSNKTEQEWTAAFWDLIRVLKADPSTTKTLFQ